MWLLLTMKRSLLSLGCLGYLASGAIDCTSSLPDDVCQLVKSEAELIFGGTLGGNFSLVVGHRDHGRILSAGVGMAADEEVVVASASKMLSAAAILWTVDEHASGSHPLRSMPVKSYLPWWKTTDPADPRADVTLEHMLSQTDGFGQSPTFNFTEGAQDIFQKDYASLATPPKIFTMLKTENYSHQMTFGPNRSSPYTWGKTPMKDLPRPGEVFYYEETHWRMAEAVVQQVAGKGLDNVTADLTAKLGMKHSHLENIPSLGGPEWISTAEDLETFLMHIVKKDLLKPETQASFEKAHTNNAKWYGFRARPEWGYALGSWSHCPKGGCSQLSSIGLFGTFPFVDFESGIYLALVRPAGLDPTRGVLMDRSVSFWSAIYPKLSQAVSSRTAVHPAPVVV
jgi:CubicO group peptidase (beta-lactamase class C family)